MFDFIQPHLVFDALLLRRKNDCRDVLLSGGIVGIRVNDINPSTISTRRDRNHRYVRKMSTVPFSIHRAVSMLNAFDCPRRLVEELSLTSGIISAAMDVGNHRRLHDTSSREAQSESRTGSTGCCTARPDTQIDGLSKLGRPGLQPADLVAETSGSP